MTRVAAVIPHWNRRDLLAALLENLGQQTRAFDEIIVVDNGSTDGSAEWAEKSGARVIRMKENRGFAAAVNRGIDATVCDLVAILNNDVTLDREWVARILEGVGDAWFACGKILCATDDAKVDGAFDEVSRAGCPLRCGSGKPDSSYWNQRRKIRVAPMTAAMFRRDLFQEVGTLDERFESYLEDVDFGIRCAAAGKAGVYIPEAVCRHIGSATRGAWNSDTVYLLSRNQVLLVDKYLRWQSMLTILVGQLLWGVVALRHRRGLAWLRGKISGLRVIRNSGEDFANQQLSLPSIFESSEEAILDVQRHTGFDWYWRSYFWLLRR